MVPASPLFDFSNLSIAERILTVEQIWDGIAAEAADAPLTPGQQVELDRRLESYRESPKDGDSWETVKSRIQAKQ
jgi:putative addiction module component (TIGR02574 family)